MKRVFRLLGVAFCAALFLVTCLQPVDEKTVGTANNPGSQTEETEAELAPAPAAFSFYFEPAPLVVGTDTIQGGKTAGTLTGLGGSGSYTFEKLSGGADDALFDLVENELKIAGTADNILDVGPYSVLVRVEDSEGQSLQKYCKMEVTRSPALITTAPKVYPSMLYDGTTKAETGFNKITVQWSQSVGATGYTIYISKASNPSAVETVRLTEVEAANAEYKKVISVFQDSGLPKGETYNVWLSAYNDDGATPVGPKATVTTSHPVQEWWYSYEGNGIIRWDSDTDDYNITATTVSYNWTRGNGYPAGFAYKGVIRHHIKFAPSEKISLMRGKYGERNGGEAGIFIIEYIHHDMQDYAFDADDDTQKSDGSTREGGPVYRANYGTMGNNFFGVYYWMAGEAMTGGSALLALAHTGMIEMYTSNSWPINPAATRGGPDRLTYEDALEVYTPGMISAWVGFVATPWFPVFDGMVKEVAALGGHCPHHQPFTVNGNPIGGSYEYRFTSNIPLTDYGDAQRVAFDLDSITWNDTGSVAAAHFYIPSSSVVTKTSTKPSLKIAFSGHDSWVRVSQSAPGEVLFAK